ncbi:tetratricopeptide repeat protein [Streptomyces virginiae]|uniref:tetratricopeptide repeat protein n=1 Tax=Streptomyces virginiae TaxID=1961 RepID=UPI0036BDA640
MNTGEQWGRTMHDEHDGQNAALTELRESVRSGMARMRLNQTQLARLTGLGRTTVSEALSPSKPPPSHQTVATLARALHLPGPKLLELLRNAVEDADGGVRSVPGRSIDEWDPHDLEVHPAGWGDAALRPGRSGVRPMPGYVRRDHDRLLAGLVEDATAGRSGAVVLVGGSSTGKTRACWEAVQPLTGQGWRLWHPFDPTRAQDALENLPRVGPRTVVWLNEAQHYLGDRAVGEQIAAALHRLLVTAERGPVLVLGTLWPEYAAQYTALPASGREDPHSRVRELLASRLLAVPETFDAPALAAATALAKGGDRLLADSLSRAGAGGRVTQDLAGAPELLNRYRNATPAASAVLEVAMDARRLGVGLHLSQAFLTDAAIDYLTDTDYDQLTDDWAEQTFAELAALVHGKQAPLRRTTPRIPRRPSATSPTVHCPAPRATGPVFRLADYLEQHGRTSRRHLCPPASFWHAAHTHLTDPSDLDNLTREAEIRHRLQWAHSLRQRAADRGSPEALFQMAMMQYEAGDRDAADALCRRAADRGNSDASIYLAEMREKAGDRDGAEALAWQAAAQGHTNALNFLAQRREKTGDQDGAEVLARKAAAQGHTNALYILAGIRRKAGDWESAETLYQQTADHGYNMALFSLGEMKEEAGDWERAEALYQQIVDHGYMPALHHLARKREKAGDRESAEALYRQVADQGNLDALLHLVAIREEVGDWENAEALAWKAADQGQAEGLYRLARRRERAGGWEDAEDLYRQAADQGNLDALNVLARRREEAGDLEGAETLFRAVADRNNITLYLMARKLERAGDRNGVEALVRRAANQGRASALLDLASIWKDAGDQEGAEAVYRQAADCGLTRPPWDQAENPKSFTRLWPYGLDPDGTPSSSW